MDVVHGEEIDEKDEVPSSRQLTTNFGGGPSEDEEMDQGDSDPLKYLRTIYFGSERVFR